MTDLIALTDLAETINTEYAAAQSDARSAVQHAIACGKALLEAKAKCKHGEWLPWLEANVKFSKDSANDYMRLAKKEHAPFLESAASIREALRLLDTEKQKPEPEQEQEPKRITSAPKKKRRTEDSLAIDEQIREMHLQGLKPHEIAKKLGVTTGTVERRLANMTIAELEQENEKLQQDTIPAAQLEEFLDLPAKKKLEKALKVFEAAKLAEMREEFTKELAAKRAELETELKAIAEKKQALAAYEDSLTKRATSITTIMTEAEYKLVRGCLHPDRQPEELRDRFGKAFDIFSRLDQTVNILAPVDWLRKYGWEKRSPRFKPSQH